MKKMLKIMAMLLVIATVIFAAGCAEKKEGAGAEKNATSEPGTNVEQANATANATVENVTVENVTVENATVENLTADNETADNETADNETADDETNNSTE